MINLMYVCPDMDVQQIRTHAHHGRSRLAMSVSHAQTRTQPEPLADVLDRFPLVCCRLELRPEVLPFSCSQTRARLLKLDPPDSKVKAELQADLQQDAIRQACVSEIEMSLVPHLSGLLGKLLQRKTAILFRDPYTQLVCNILCSRMLPTAKFHHLVYFDPFYVSSSETGPPAFSPTHSVDDLMRSVKGLREKLRNEMKVKVLNGENEELRKQLERTNKKLLAVTAKQRTMANPQAQSNSLNPLKTALDTMTAERDTALQRVEELVAQRPSTQVLLQELQQLQAEVSIWIVLGVNCLQLT